MAKSRQTIIIPYMVLNHLFTTLWWQGHCPPTFLERGVSDRELHTVIYSVVCEHQGTVNMISMAYVIPSWLCAHCCTIIHMYDKYILLHMMKVWVSHYITHTSFLSLYLFLRSSWRNHWDILTTSPWQHFVHNMTSSLPLSQTCVGWLRISWSSSPLSSSSSRSVSSSGSESEESTTRQGVVVAHSPDLLPHSSKYNSTWLVGISW